MSDTAPETVEIGEAVIFQSLDDEVVLLNMTNQQYYGLDDVGAAMWHLLVKHHDVETVVAKLNDIYDVDEDRLREDLQALIRNLVDVDLLKKTPATAK
ncbi:MAG: PqqD family protein [Acidobacteriota bacterium]|nr:PqqD family protein [Acidobacteriota bacterium]